VAIEFGIASPSTLARVDAVPKGLTWLVDGVEESDRSVPGRTVACILANELAVGLNKVDARFAAGVLAPRSPAAAGIESGAAGGAGAGRAVRMRSA